MGRKKSLAGVSGTFSFYLVRGVPGDTFETLFKGEPGAWELRDPSKLIRKIDAKNKWTKRGLAAVLYLMAGYMDSVNSLLPDINAATNTKNPFAAFFVQGDATIGELLYFGDTRVKWDESDNATAQSVPPISANAGQGSRSLNIDTDTTGPGLKRLSIAYPSTTPYREIEYVLFAQANTSVKATGQVVVSAGSSMGDGATLRLDDGYNAPLIFVFDIDASVSYWDGDPSNYIPIRFASGDSQATVRDNTVAVVNSVLSGITEDDTEGLLNILAEAGAGDGDVNLTHVPGGAIGNTYINVSGTGVTSTDFAGGGGALEIGDRNTNIGYIDNLIIKSVGLAAGRECGNGETDNQVGLRSVLGVSPKLQGFSDRIYVHEGTSLHKYTSGEDVDAQGDGYVVSGHEQVTVRTITVDAADRILAADNSMYFEKGDLSLDDRGSSIVIVGGTNAGTHRITKVISTCRCLVATSISSDSSGAWTSTTLVDLNTGDHAFDGDVEYEGNATVPGHVTSAGWVLKRDWGARWRSVDGNEPHTVGRVFGTALSSPITGLRIVFPRDGNIANCPDKFLFQYLDSTKAGVPPGSASGDLTELDPMNDDHWTNIDSSYTGQGTDVYAARDVGAEYLFTTPPPAVNCFGIRVTAMQGTVTTGAVEIDELLLFTTRGALSLSVGSNDALSLATDQSPSSPGTPNATPGTMRTYNLGTVVTSGNVNNNDMQTIVDAINAKVRGFELIAERTELGYLLLRATVAGDETQLDLAAEGSEGVNSTLGFPAAATSKAGRTRRIVKFPEDTLTITYRASISGDLPE